jgi:hypothetical protein
MATHPTAGRTALPVANAPKPATDRVASRPAAAPADTDDEQYKHLRKASPADVLLPRTKEWAAGLPPEVQPQALMRRYARIANLIAAAWGDAKAFHAYMESLLTDKRGNRRGFPPDVQQDLATLRRYYGTHRENSTPWAYVTKRGG